MLNSLRSPATGKLLALPMYSDQWTWHYNKELTSKAGLDPENPPTTWQEYFDATPEVQGGRHLPERRGLAGDASRRSRSSSGRCSGTRSASRCSARTGPRCCSTTEDGLQTFRTIEDGIKAGFWDPNGDVARPRGRNGLLFNQGLIAGHMGWGSYWVQARSGNVADFNATIKPEVVGVATIPGIEAGQSGTVNGSEGIGLLKFSEKQDAALSFLKYTSSAAQEKATFLGTDPNASSLTPSRTSVLNDPEVQAKFSIGPVWAEQGTFQNSLHAAPYDPAARLRRGPREARQGRVHGSTGTCRRRRGLQEPDHHLPELVAIQGGPLRPDLCTGGSTLARPARPPAARAVARMPGWID